MINLNPNIISITLVEIMKKILIKILITSNSIDSMIPHSTSSNLTQIRNNIKQNKYSNNNYQIIIINQIYLKMLKINYSKQMMMNGRIIDNNYLNNNNNQYLDHLLKINNKTNSNKINLRYKNNRINYNNNKMMSQKNKIMIVVMNYYNLPC